MSARVPAWIMTIGAALAQSPIPSTAEDVPPKIEEDVSPCVVRDQFADWWGYWFQKDDNAAVKLKDAFTQDWDRASEAERSYQNGEDASTYNKRLDLSQAQFLCSWKETHAPPGNPKPLFVCNRGSTVAKQVADAGAMATVAAAKANENDRISVAEHEAKFNEKVGRMPSDDICRNYSKTRYKSGRAELTRRNALTSAEWILVDQRRIEVGMSELALLCSLGENKVNRTVTAGGTHKQYVYGFGVFVYVENGTVVGFQD